MRRAALLALALALGCKIDLDRQAVDDTPDASPDLGRACKTVTTSATCTEVEGRSDFFAIQANILEENCDGSSCHSSGATIDLSRTAAYTALLGASGTGAPSQFDSNHLLVSPGNPSASYLMYLVRGVDAGVATPAFAMPPEDPGFMPSQSGTICCQKIDALERWIAAGAMP